MFRLTAIIILLLGLLGCSFLNKNDSSSFENNTKSDNAIIDSSNYELSIKDLIKKSIEKDFENFKLTIKEINTFENYSFVIFLLEKKNILYEGLACIEKEQKFYKLNEIDIAKADLKTPFTKHTLGLSLRDGRNCRLIGGYINDKSIKEICIEYKNNSVNIIKIGQKQNTYMDYIIGDINYVKEIVGFNVNNKEIYSYK